MEKLNSIVGMKKKKELARIQILSCLKQGKPFPHTLLYGIGGLGKTKFARAIANEIDYRVFERQGSSVSREDIQELMLGLPAHKTSLIFIDECHRLGETQEELYVPMAEFKLPTDTGPKVIRPFTLFAATTRMDLLDANSFVTRFANVWELTRYTQAELAYIVSGFFAVNKIICEKLALKEIVQRSLGIPRIALGLANKAMDVALAYDSQVISVGHALHAFNLENIDTIGLNSHHRRYMEILYKARKAVGASSIASMMRLTKNVVEGSIEPILLELGLVKIDRGRLLTEKGKIHLTQ